MNSHSGILVVVALALCACQSGERKRFVLTDDAVFNTPPPPPEEPEDSVQESYFAGTEQLRHARGIRIFPGGVIKIHGREAAWFMNGKQEYERFFNLGEPTGLWRTWYRDGTPHSEIYCDPDGIGTTSWWYSNGQLSSQGPAVAGQKHGAWTHFYEDGSKTSEGAYKRGRKHGDWSFWDAAGQLTAKGRYENGVRVGAWELRSESGDAVIRGE